MTIFNIHAPREDKESGNKDKYYENLENEMDKIPRKDIKMIVGDMNSKVGRKEIYRKITGGENKHQVINEKGIILITLAIERQSENYE